MRLHKQAKGAVIDDRMNRRNPVRILRHLVYRMFDRTKHTVDTNEDRACSRTRSWLGG